MPTGTWRGGEAVTQGSAKPPCTGSIPVRASENRGKKVFMRNIENNQIRHRVGDALHNGAERATTIGVIAVYLSASTRLLGKRPESTRFLKAGATAVVAGGAIKLAAQLLTREPIRG